MDRSDLEQWKPKEVARLLALVEAERRYYQDIVAGLPVGLLVLSSGLSIISANNAVRRIFRLRTGDPLRGKLDVLFPGEILDRVHEALAGGKPPEDVTVIRPAEHGGGTLRVAIQLIRSWDFTEEQEILLVIQEIAVGAGSTGPLDLPMAEDAPEALEEQESPTAAAEPVEAPAPAEPVSETAAPAQPQQPTPPETSEAEPVSETAIPDSGAAELLNHLDAVVWAASLPDMNELFVNEAGSRILGWTADETAPAVHIDRIHSADRERVRQEYAYAIERRQSVTIEFRAVTATGETVWLRESVRPLLDEEGNPRHAVGLAIDITSRRHEEEARLQAARSESLNRLCSRLAHDMNNLLMIVNGYSEEILGTLSGASPLHADLAEVRNAGERLSYIADQLLAFTRRRAEPTASLNATAVLHEVAAAPGPALATDTTVMAVAGEAVWVRAAREQLAEIVRAFVRYADHLQGGEIALSTEADGTYGAIRIAFPGRESAPEAWQTLFEGILPPKDSPAELVQAISRAWSTVQQWGGLIVVDDDSATGTSVSILLPLGEAPPVPLTAPAAEPPAPEPELEPEPEPEPEPETVLVVEDETGIRALVRKILERQGYRVLDAARADDAIRLCQEFHGEIRLVITDVVMPEMGGREMVEKLISLRPDLKVLYVSGYTDDPQIYASHVTQGSSFLQKPFTLGALLDKVREVLENE